MKFININDPSEKMSFLEAVEQGVGAQGGLLVPESFPQFEVNQFKNLDFISIATQVLQPFLAENFSTSEISKIVSQAFNFPIPLKKLNAELSLLELFHGPTAAFKDVAAQFIAEVMSRGCKGNTEESHKTSSLQNTIANNSISLPNTSSNKTVIHPIQKTILVATSGDTGGAVASAFFRRPGFRVVILFPHHGVSVLQRNQLTGWGENIISLAVEGSFDQCQSLVKELLAQPALVKQYHFTSANSINVARLFPQACYYAASSLWWWQEKQTKANYFIPTGNMGNALGAVWARRMGFPIDQITMATNANHVIADYFQTGVWAPHPSLSTLANAMDVGNPSNFVRLQYLFPNLAELKTFCRAIRVSDEEIKNTIIKVYHEFHEIICPHTATAFAAHFQSVAHPQSAGRVHGVVLSQAAASSQSGSHFQGTCAGGIIVATAHPSKFKETVEPLLNKTVDWPTSMRHEFQSSRHYPVIAPTMAEILTYL